MTDKKKRILAVALELFANDGFSATSTSKIAKVAEVSEGLIFKHFGSKQGLLEALVEQAAQRLANLIAPIMSETNASKAVQKAITLPYSVPVDEYPYWKLQFKLKWEKDYDSTGKMGPLLNRLVVSFTELGYVEPEKEAQLLLHIIDGIAMGILNDGIESQRPLKRFLIEKYITPHQ